MDYSGNVDYDVNTPFKYEGDDQDHPPSSGGVGGAADDPNKHMPVHHNQDDLIYPPLDFATPTPNAVDTPHSAPSIRHHMNNQSAHGLDLNPNSNAASSILSGTTSSVAMETNSSDAPVAMETNSDAAVTMETSDVRPPSSPESDEIPLAARRTRPSRSTRSKKSLVEVNDEEEDEFEVKPPKGIKLYEDISPALIGTQSIFCSAIQKERRARLTKGSKRKKKKEPEFCRFCFTNELSLHKIRSAKLPPTSSHPNTKLTSLVPTLTEIDLCLTEKWTNPSFQLVCDDCVTVFSQFHEFRTAVQTNDTLLRRLYCSSKAKSKKPPTPAVPPRAQSPAPIPSTGKGRRRALNYKDPTSEEDSDARSIVSKKKSTRGRRKGVTDDEETDGYLSSVSKASRKSTTSRRGANKKKRGGVTSDEETDGYMSSVSRKSTNTTPAAKSNSKKKKRYNSDSDNEDVKSDVSDGMDFGPTAYDTSARTARSNSRRKSILGVKSESEQDCGDDVIKHDSYNDDSDLDNSAKVNSRPNVHEANLAHSIFSEEESDVKAISVAPRNRERAKRRETPTIKRSVSVSKSFGDLPNIVGKNIGIFTNSSKIASNYFDILFKNRSVPASNDNAATSSVNVANTADYVTVKEENEEWDADYMYLSNDDDRCSPNMSDSSIPDTTGGKRKRKRGRPKTGDNGRKGRLNKRKKKENLDKKRARLREELKVKMAEAQDKPVEFDGDLENLKFEADEFFDGDVPLYESSSDKEDYDEEEEIEEEMWQCRHCPLKHRSHDLLLRHYTKEHGGYDWASVCYYCGYFNGHKKMIYLHIKDHYAPKKREMKICDICCAEVLHLQQHQKAAHSGVCYDCTFCGKGFTRKAELNIHIKAVHLKHQLEQRFVCQYCNKDFPFMKYLKRHLRVHSNDMQVPNPYKCSACNAAFNTKSALNVHRKTCPNLELLNRDLLPNQTGTVTPEPPPQPPPLPSEQQRGGTRASRPLEQPPPPPPLVPIPQQQEDPQQQILLQSLLSNSGSTAARDLLSVRDLQIGLALPPPPATSRELQIANTARELQLASTARELQLTNLSARDLQNLQNAKFERPQMYYY